MDFQELQNKLKTPPTPGRKRAVLLCTGSLCPVHQGHLQILDIASKFLSEECNIDSLVAYISPSCDSYVFYKLGNDMIPFTHRFEMLKLACNEHNSQPNVIPIIPDSWEGLQPDFVDFPEVRKHFVKEIKKAFPDQDLHVLYVSGADHFMKCRLYNGYGYVGISRVGYKIQATSNYEHDIYVCNDPKYQNYYSDASSTAIRKAKEKKQSIDGLTYASVVKYLHDVVHWI